MEFGNMNPINPNGLNQLKSESNSSVSPSDVLPTIANLQVVSRTDTSTDYYRITDATQRASVYFLFSLQNLKILVCGTESYPVILWNMEFITLWTSGVKKTTEWFISNVREYECECKCLFLIFVHANANANSKKTCEYSHLRMRIFGPSLLCMALSFTVLLGVLMYVSYMGELTVWIVFPTVTIRMYRTSPLVPLDSCLTAAACLSSAC